MIFKLCQILQYFKKFLIYLLLVIPGIFPRVIIASRIGTVNLNQFRS